MNRMDADSPSSNAPEQKIAEPAPPRARWRKVLRRILKYGLSVSQLGVICLIVIAWVRSSTWNDRVELDIATDRVILFKSKQGELTIGIFKTERGIFYRLREVGPGFPRPMRRFSVLVHPPARTNLEKSHTTFEEKVKENKTSIGVGIVSQIDFSKTHFPPINVLSLPNKYLVTGYSGHGIILPHWLLLFVLGSMFTVIVLGRRFSLRAFLIWITIVCVILAIAVRTSGDSNQNQDRSVQDGV
jgi:hypothetical protein